MHLLKRFLADERGVAVIFAAMVGGLAIPFGVGVYYYTQLSASTSLLYAVCPTAVAAYVEAEKVEDRDPAMQRIIKGLLGDDVVNDISADVDVVSGTDTFKHGDAETDRPIYELTLTAKDRAARGQYMDNSVSTSCKATLKFTGKPASETRVVKVLAGRVPHYDPEPDGWGEETSESATDADLRLYVTRKIGGLSITSHIWSRKDGATKWLYPTDTDERTEGSFANTDSLHDIALRKMIRPTHFVQLTPAEGTSISTEVYSQTAPLDRYPAIKPRCYDSDDSDDNDGFGWEPDPALLTAGGEGEIGTRKGTGEEYIAFVGVDGTKTLDSSGHVIEDESARYQSDHDWGQWEFSTSTDGGVTKKAIDNNIFSDVSEDFEHGEMRLQGGPTGGRATGVVIFETRYTTEDNPGGKAAVISYLYQYEMTMTAECDVTYTTRVSVPVSDKAKPTDTAADTTLEETTESS